MELHDIIGIVISMHASGVQYEVARAATLTSFWVLGKLGSLTRGVR